MESESLTFTCNVCEAVQEVSRGEVDRESPSCGRCGSSVRYRSVVHVLSTALFGESIPLPSFPVRRDVVGVGLSDWLGYADTLSERLGYRNTYYHSEPRLDVTDVPRELHSTFDFVICSDVLEHVAPPPGPAFQSLYDLLKPGGVVVLTVPYGPEGDLTEHYPELDEYEVLEFRGRPILVNRTEAGSWQVFEDPVFHGGVGETLEMRVFSRRSLFEHLARAGFVEIAEYCDDYEPYGILWPKRWSAPFLAKRPA